MSILIIALVLVQLAAIPTLHRAYAFTVKNQIQVKTQHKKNLLSYLNTKEEKWLQKTSHMHIPFPRSQALINMIDKFNREGILPYQLQTPKPLEYDFRWSIDKIAESPFIVNGTVKASTKEHEIRPFEQNVFGSYKPKDLGVQAVGMFESTEFHHDKDYIAVPVTGYFGYPNMSIKLIDAVNGQEFDLPLGHITNKTVETWRYIVFKLPKGYYKLVAEDWNKTLWFGFATPKSVGRWSYRIEQLITSTYTVWMLGCLFILVSVRRFLHSQFSN
jgi:hypothetical protein